MENRKIIEKIRYFLKERDQTSGSQNIHQDYKEAGFHYSLNHIARLMRKAGIQDTYRRKKHPYLPSAGPIHNENQLNREFTVNEPNKAWCIEITYIRTYEGLLYLTVVIDLFSRRVVGWSMKSNQKTTMEMDALFMAVKKKKTEAKGSDPLRPVLQVYQFYE